MSARFKTRRPARMDADAERRSATSAQRPSVPARGADPGKPQPPVRLALHGAFEAAVSAPSEPVVAQRLRVWQRPVPAAVAVVAVLALGGLAVWASRASGPQSSPKRFTLTLPDSDRLPRGSGDMLALSPDGQTIVYRATRGGRGSRPRHRAPRVRAELGARHSLGAVGWFVPHWESPWRRRRTPPTNTSSIAARSAISSNILEQHADLGVTIRRRAAWPCRRTCTMPPRLRRLAWRRTKPATPSSMRPTTPPSGCGAPSCPRPTSGRRSALVRGNKCSSRPWPS